MLERPIAGSTMGFTLTCILEREFKKLRFGDRFWYERDDHQTGFTPEQLAEIRKSTIARIICDNANDVVNIQRNAFMPGTNSAGDNPRIFCDELDFVNLNVFREGKTLFFCFCFPCCCSFCKHWFHYYLLFGKGSQEFIDKKCIKFIFNPADLG